MGILYIILLVVIELYTAGIVIYFFYQFSRRKKISAPLIIAELICITAFIYFKFRIREGTLVFVKGYEDVFLEGSYGFGNMISFIINQGILVVLFFLTQIIFWFLYRRYRNKLKDRTLSTE